MISLRWIMRISAKSLDPIPISCLVGQFYGTSCCSQINRWQKIAHNGILDCSWIGSYFFSQSGREEWESLENVLNKFTLFMWEWWLVSLFNESQEQFLSALHPIAPPLNIRCATHNKLVFSGEEKFPVPVERILVLLQSTLISLWMQHEDVMVQQQLMLIGNVH